MTRDDLNELRLVNPVAEDAAAELVAGTAPELLAELGRTTALPHGESVRPAAVEVDPGWARPQGRRPARANVLAVAAVTLAVLAVPFVALLMSGQSSDDTRQVPADRVPTPSDLAPPDPTTLEADDAAAPPTTTVSTERSTPSEPAVPVAPIPTSDPEATLATTAPIVVAPPATVGSSAPSTTPDTAAPSSPATTAPPEPTAPPATSAPATTVAVAIGDVSEPFEPGRDLLMITLDFADRDDGHSAAADLEIATRLGISPLVVAGTQAAEADGFVHEYEVLMDAVWGSAWLDATGDRASALDAAADSWLQTIDRGGTIRVAEGGVSDFTADVLREVRRRRPALDTMRVVDVTHHIRRNEDATRPGDLDLVRRFTTYRRIDDGNNLNGTADLKDASSLFESAALDGPHAEAWTSAFEYSPPSALDFSDTVTVLHVVGIGVDRIANADDFATYFML